MKNVSAFTKTRLTLTFWYCLTLLIIIVAFSIVLYAAQSSNFDRIVLRRDYGNNLPKILTQKELTQLSIQVEVLRKTFAINLITVDFIILIVGGGLSFFLAGKTLEPITESLKKQKQFIADASHELKTPLAAIRIASEVALRKKNKEKKSLEKVIKQSLEESIRLGKIVEELLLLSRVDSYNSGNNFHKVSLDEIAVEELNKIKPLLEKKKITIKYKDIKRTEILGDKDKINQLLVILLDNAIKYNGEKGYLGIKVTPNPNPTLLVSDTGVGISKEDRKRIFDRFYQVEKSRSGNGAGLGLSIAKTITDSHNAKITVKSSPGAGSSFKIVFPKA